MWKKARRANEVILGSSEAIRRLCEEIEVLAQGPIHSVLVVGETGTGKDLVPRALAACSEDWSDHVEAFNCPAVPTDHLESELFGTTRGAFPGAVDRPGAAERAAGGTLFLDEIAAMPAMHQGKILRLLESGEGRRLGASRSYCTDAVVVAATNEDLRAAVARHAFREDLYYRLAQDAVLVVPPLRERIEDIPLLAEIFLAQVDSRARIDATALAELSSEEWPGNVRQLRAVVRSASRLAGRGRSVEGRHVREAVERIAPGASARHMSSVGPKRIPSPSCNATRSRLSPASPCLEPDLAFYEAEASERRRMLIAALHAANGNQTEAGVALGLHVTRHGADAAADRQARRLAERKFRYWWTRLVEPASSPPARHEVTPERRGRRVEPARSLTPS